MTLSPQFAINPKSRITIEYVGNEKTPVVILDDLLLDTQSVIAQAVNNVSFDTINSSLYPGVRTILPQDYVVTILRALVRKLYEVFSIPQHLTLTPLGVYYSLLNVMPEQLTSKQRIPHFDTDRSFYLALLHYLDPHVHGGTGFFRHKETGYERINEQRSPHYLNVINQQLKGIEQDCVGYCTATNPYFELYHQIEYQPNRMLIYPGNMLHSGIVDVNTDISPNPSSGRLTANTFIEFT